MLMRDAVATLVMLAIVYFSFLLTFWRDVPYQMEISANDVAAIEQALDKATFLIRESVHFIWKRRSAFATAQDSIKIVVASERAEIEARKRDVFRIRDMLNKPY